MKKTFSKSYILKNRGCYDTKQVKELSFINRGRITIEDILTSEISLSDKYWFIMNSCELDFRKRVELRAKIRASLSPQWVWVVDGAYFWYGASYLPGSEKKKILSAIKKYFK